MFGCPIENSIDVWKRPDGIFPHSVICPMTGSFAIDVGFALEGSQLRVCPKFAHKEIPNLTFFCKQALDNTISR
jgi:hypothetical protein